MPVRRTITEFQGIYFITFTCARWVKLFELTNSYDLVYNWFTYLQKQNHHIIGYVIMPEHVHALIAFSNHARSMNSIVGNGKRFIAYELVERLKKNRFDEMLDVLHSWVNATDRNRDKKHEFFERSLDWKECNDERLVEQKLNYIHENASRGEDRFVENCKEGPVKIMTWLELQDVDLSVGCSAKALKKETLRTLKMLKTEPILFL